MRRARQCFIVGLLTVLLIGCSTFSPSKNSQKSQSRETAHNPDAALINVQLGVAYLRQGDNDRAKRKLTLALQQDPQSAIVLDAMAYFLESTGEPKSAENFYKKAVTVNSNRGSAENNYGAFLCRQKRYKAGEAHFLLATQAENYLTPADAFENAGLCALDEGKLARAEHYFTKALQKQPRSAKSLLKLAQIHYTEGDFILARQYMERYLANNPPTAESLLLGLRVADHLGDTKTVVVNSTQLRERYATSREYQELLAAEKAS